MKGNTKKEMWHPSSEDQGPPFSTTAREARSSFSLFGQDLTFGRIALLVLILVGAASVWRLTSPAPVSLLQTDPGPSFSPRLTRIQETGRRIYVSICAYCHGENGDGFGLNAPNLEMPPRDHTDPAYMHSRTDQQLFAVIKDGGALQGKSALMPPWGGRLTDREIAALVSYLRTLSRDQMERQQETR
jgi:mono/diheme cytochrome c family protein